MNAQSQEIQPTPLALPPINEYGRLDMGSYLKYIMYVYGVVMLVIQTASMPGEVLLKRKFGERYLDPLMVLLGFAGIFILGAGGSYTATGTDISLVMFSFVYVVVAILQRLAIFHRDLKGENWHSQSSGISWPLLTGPAKLLGSIIGSLPPRRFGEGYRMRFRAFVVDFFQLFVEPMIVALAGIVMIGQGLNLGPVLPAIATAMLIRNVLEYHMQRTRMLEIVDASIEAENCVDVLSGSKGPEEAQGYKVSGVRLPASARRMIAGAYMPIRRPANEAA